MLVEEGGGGGLLRMYTTNLESERVRDKIFWLLTFQ